MGKASSTLLNSPGHPGKHPLLQGCLAAGWCVMCCCRLAGVINSQKAGCTMISWLKDDFQRLSSWITRSCWNWGQDSPRLCLQPEEEVSEQLKFQRDSYILNTLGEVIQAVYGLLCKECTRGEWKKLSGWQGKPSWNLLSARPEHGSCRLESFLLLLLFPHTSQIDH